MKRTIALALAGIAWANVGVQAQQAPDTLAKIRDARAVTLGVRDASVPFSYLNDKQQAVGYSIDLCLKLVDAIRSEIGVPNLEVKRVTVTSQTRIPLMVNGTIDMECGSTTNNAERRQQVSFTVPFYVASALIMAPRSANIRTLADLKGKTVVSTAGGTTIRHLQRISQEMNLDLKLPTARDHADAWLFMETGRADAVANDDVLLFGLRANSKDPQAFAALEQPLSSEPYGIMLPRGDERFKRLMDRTLAELYRSGEAQKIYERWFNQPIPPQNVNLQLPLSAELKAVFANPVDPQ